MGMTGWKRTAALAGPHWSDLDLDLDLDENKTTHHFRVDGDLSEALPLAPQQRVGLIAEQGLADPPWRNPQQVALLKGPDTLLPGAVDHAEHLQEQLEAWREMKLLLSTEVFIFLNE